MAARGDEYSMVAMWLWARVFREVLIGCSYSKPPMCGIGGDVDIYARRSMRCRELVISELGARLAGCELVVGLVEASMHNVMLGIGCMSVWVCRVAMFWDI